MATQAQKASAATLRERNIRPLPVRSKNRSIGNSNQSIEDATDGGTDAGHRSNPAPQVLTSGPPLGRTANSAPLDKEGPISTIRPLRNITPEPSLELETDSLLLPQENPTKSGTTSENTMSAQDQIFQDGRTTYTDESISSPSANGGSESSASVRISNQSHASPGTTHSLSSRPMTPASLVYTSDLNSSPLVPPSDVSIIINSNESPSPYDVRDEEAPVEPFFEPAFQTALQHGLATARRTLAAIERTIGSPEPMENFQRLIDDAQALSTFQTCDTKTIAVLGDSGEGKSSLINSLLHFPEIAKTGDIGSACTSVVTEYRQKTNNHTAPITIEVEFLSTSEIEELIRELLWSYRQPFIPDMEEEEVTSKEFARMQRESDQAWSALEAAFKHQEGFNQRLLSDDMSEDGRENVSTLLIQWAHSLEWPDGNNSGRWKSTADSADECCMKTSIFMEDRFWPFTKIIRVYLSSEVLKTGVVLADLPGLQDTNLARVRATQEYLLKCDNIFIVAKISRAITDQSLKSSLFSILTRHVAVEWEELGGKNLSLAIVCTKSEDINQKTARREFCGDNKQIPSSTMERLDRDIKNAKQRSDKKLKKQLKRKQELLLVNARNSHVKERLQGAYSSKVHDGRLDVFCVSNTMYEKYSRKGNTEMVNASGVPELRRFCHTITAKSRLREAKHFLQSRLPSLLASVELLASSSSQPAAVDRSRDESIMDILTEIRVNALLGISDHEEELNGTLREVLFQFLERRNQAWDDAADLKGRDWQVYPPWHHTRYNAWCLNSGNHRTATFGPVNWNSELIWKMRIELATQWELLEDDEIPEVFDKLLQSSRRSILELATRLGAHDSMTSVVAGIDFRMQDIEYKFILIREKLIRDIKYGDSDSTTASDCGLEKIDILYLTICSLIRRYASEPNESSYIASEMIPVYRKAAAVKGTGRMITQHNIVQGRITNGTLFLNISVKIHESMVQLVEAAFAKVRNATNAVLDLVQGDIQMAITAGAGRIGAGVQEDGQEDERMRGLLAEIEELKEEHDGILASIVSM